MPRFTLRDLAERVLNEKQIPLTAMEIWDIAKEKGYDKEGNFIGKAPWYTIARKITLDIKDNPETKFIRINSKPSKFFLKNLASESELIEIERKQFGMVEKPKRFNYTERQLHPVLAYFSYTYLNIYTKTIFHEKSLKSSKYLQWLHPDMVGVNFPINEWEQELLSFSKALGSLPIKIYSFEIKRELGFHNLRESFFQAVSNSSWAHEGYLVASVIHQDEEFLSELKRLSSSFNIGIIRLDVTDPDSSEMLYSAKEKESLDWNTVNKLVNENKDFKRFLISIKKDILNDEIIKERYDKIPKMEKLLDTFKNR